MDFIYKAIPKELIKNQEISKDKMNEINNVIQNEVNNAVILFNKKRKEFPLFENFLGDQILIKIVDDKIKELMSNIHYSEDKIPYNSDNFYGLFKKNERIILNSNENHRSFNKCDEFCKNVLNNKKYKEEIKFNINELDKLINSLNLFNGIQNNKYNEIRNLFNEMKNKTNDRIINEKNSLSNWKEKKENLILRG